MENNQTIKNMELILLEIRKHVFTKGTDTRAPKTLIHSYLSMLNIIDRMDVKERAEALVPLRTHAKSLVQMRKYIEMDKMHELLKVSDFVGVNNYTITLSKIVQAIETIGIETEKEQFTSSAIIEDLLELSVKSGTLVTFFNEVHRGMGKTTALVKKAHELDAVLIVGFHAMVKETEKIAESLGLDVVVSSPGAALSLTKMRNGYLVDETVEKSSINKLSSRGCRLLGGFTRIAV